ncbi:hypothetical protein [Solibacillus sp. FSL H8-0538]|uniref:hypothetical protein n=1 Tax=Solibacillus sp. FSL H8-0538 TaxID=2921400 RepID=UPI0030FB4280
MPQQKLTIIPITLHSEFINSSVATSTEDPRIRTCPIKTATVEISLCNGVDEHIIQSVTLMLIWPANPSAPQTSCFPHKPPSKH